MVPEKWKYQRLGTVAELQRGFDLPSQKRIDGNIPIISSSGLSGYHNESKVKAPGIVTGRYGSIGSVFYVQEDFWPLNTSLWVKKFHGNDPKFIYFLLSNFDFKKFSDKTGVPGVNRNDLHAVKVHVPPLPEQHKIAKTLSTWDKAIRTTERLIDNSKKHKKALMNQLLSGKKRLLDDSGKPYESKWEKVKLNSTLDLMKSGLSRKLENENIGIAVIRSNNMGTKFTKSTDLKYWYLEDPKGAKIQNYVLDNGDLLVNFINSPSQIGKACIYKKVGTIDSIYTTNILRIKANMDKVDPVFLYLLTQTEQYDAYVKSITKPAVNQASFTTKEFGNFEFRLPSLTEQQKVTAVLTNADKEIELLKQKLVHLKQEKKALMQQLLTGKRRVKVDATEAA